jgi:hypothetical protein
MIAIAERRLDKDGLGALLREMSRPEPPVRPAEPEPPG